jgi:GNAT superfamily N-acetyltransferase
VLQVRKVIAEEEIEALYRFRYQIYVEEESFTRRADHKRRQLKDELDNAAHSYAIFDGARVLGSLRVLFLDEIEDISLLVNKFRLQPALEALGPGAICTTSRFMIDPSLRNGKIIFRLMRIAYEDILQKGARINYGDCSPHMIPFYEHLGYRRYTRGFNDSDYGYKIPILMLLRDQIHLAEVGSLLLSLAREYQDDADARAWFTNNYPEYLETRCSVFVDDQVFIELLAERLAKDPLHHLALIQGLSEVEAKTFFAEATILPMHPGDLIIRKGDTDSSVYVLLKGLAEVKPDLDAPVSVAVLGAGDTFGEIGFLTSSPRTANVIAQTELEVLILTGEFMERILKLRPGIAAKVALNLSKELAARLALTTSAFFGR